MVHSTPTAGFAFAVGTAGAHSYNPVAVESLRSLLSRTDGLWDLLQRPRRVFVETGTFVGQTVDAVVGAFDQITSIEFDPTLAAEGTSLSRHVPLWLSDSLRIRNYSV